MTGAPHISAGTEHAGHHDLKCWPEFFEALIAGKPFELRNNDRDFRVGDELNLHEYNPATSEFSGRALVRKVTYILGHRPDAGCAATFGLQPGYVILGIASAAQGSLNREQMLERAISEACDLLAERTYGNPARSPGHNARLRLEQALVAQVYAAQPPAAPVETEEWEEVTDGTTKPGDRFSYIGNSETGVGQITSHKRRVSRISAGNEPARETVARILAHKMPSLRMANDTPGNYAHSIADEIVAALTNEPQGASK